MFMLEDVYGYVVCESRFLVKFGFFLRLGFREIYFLDLVFGFGGFLG